MGIYCVHHGDDLGIFHWKKYRHVLGKVLVLHDGLVHVTWSNYMRLRLINGVWSSQQHASGEQHSCLCMCWSMLVPVRSFADMAKTVGKTSISVLCWSRKAKKNI